MFKNRLLGALVAIATALGMSANVLAAETAVDNVPVETGVYFGPNFGYGHSALNAGSFDGAAGQLVLNPELGYQFNSYAAFEFGFTRFASLTGQVDTGSAASSSSVKISSHYVDLAMKGMYPVSQHLMFFGKAGVATVSTKYSSNVSENGGDTLAVAAGNYHERALFLAAGLSYQIKRTMSLDMQVANTSSKDNVPSLLAITVGMSHLFAI